MKTKSPVMALAAFLFLLNVCVSPPAYGGRIEVVVDHGVDKDAEAQAQATVNGVFDFFQKTYSIGLHQDIRIKLSCDKLNYKKAIMTEYGESEARAAYQANRSLGLQNNGTLLVDMGERKNRHGKLFTLCHEIVHFYQNQESQNNHGSIRWMTEGSANAVAAHIMETVGGQSAGTYKKCWIENLKKAQNWPRLENLRDPNQIAVYLGYDTASLAVMTLVEQRGYPALFTYFQNLKNTNPDEAFYKAFGTRLSDFEKSFHPF